MYKGVKEEEEEDGGGGVGMAVIIVAVAAAVMVAGCGDSGDLVCMEIPLNGLSTIPPPMANPSSFSSSGRRRTAVMLWSPDCLFCDVTLIWETRNTKTDLEPRNPLNSVDL